MNKKLTDPDPVIAVMLLVAVVVAAIGAYFIWYKSFKAGSQKDVEDTVELIGYKLNIIDITNDIDTFYITLKNQTGEEITASDVYVEIECNGKKEDILKIKVPKAIPDDEEGYLEVSLNKITHSGNYTIRITANGVTRTERYTAI